MDIIARGLASLAKTWATWRTRTATFVIAASNSKQVYEDIADYVCDGVDDQVQIQAAIDALPEGGGRIFCAAGKYMLSAHILINRNLVRLEGEGFGFWLRNLFPSPEGTGFTIFHMTAVDHCIYITTLASGPYIGERPQGIDISRIYMYGASRVIDKCGIFCDTNADQMIFDKLFIQNFMHGIVVSHDAIHLTDCTVMECGGNGIWLSGGWFGSIRGSCVADCGGVGICVTSTWSRVTSNELVRCAGGGIAVWGGSWAALTGNTFFGCQVKYIHANDVSGLAVVGNTINNGYAAYGVYFERVTDSTISGNTFIANTGIVGPKEAIKIVDGSGCRLDASNIISSGWASPPIVVSEGNSAGTLVTSTPVNAVAATGIVTFTGAVADTETVTVGTRIYEFDTNSTVTSGNVAVDISGGGSASQAVTALALAIETDTSAVVHAVDGTGDTVDLTAKTKGVSGNALALAKSGTEIAVSHAHLGDGAGCTAGVDGTIGYAGEIRRGASYFYVCQATNTIADGNWTRAGLASY